MKVVKANEKSSKIFLKSSFSLNGHSSQFGNLPHLGTQNNQNPEKNQLQKIKDFSVRAVTTKKKIRRVTLHIISQEHKGAPIYWSHKILFSIFWKGMKREGYDKTRFCVSREGLLNVTGTFSLP